VIATSLFLSESGYLFKFGDREIERFTLQVAEGKLSFREIKKWIRRRMIELQDAKSC
jgi:prophage maintenance system killer protein